MSSITRQALRDTLAKKGPEDFKVMADLLARRYSCRAFRPDPVPKADIERMLTLAQMTPSWANTQPWQVIITSGDATERLRQALLEDFDSPEPFLPSDFPFPETYSGFRLDRRREVGWQLYESVGVPKGDRVASSRQARENQRLFGAPHAILISVKREMGTYGVLDCGLYLGNLLLAAEAIGIGMIAQAALAQHCGLIRKMFGLQDDEAFVVGGSFGYPDLQNPVNQFRSLRADRNETVTWVDS